MVIVGRMNDHSLVTMVFAYAFAIVGLSVGMFPWRKKIKQSTLDQKKGIHKEYGPARGYATFCITCVLISLFAAYVLTVPSPL